MSQSAQSLNGRLSLLLQWSEPYVVSWLPCVCSYVDYMYVRCVSTEAVHSVAELNGGEGLHAFRDCWGANAFLQAAPEVSKPAGCFIPLEQHDQSLFQICCVCHFVSVIYLTACPPKHIFQPEIASSRDACFQFVCCSWLCPLLALFSLTVCSVTAPLVCA